MESNVIVIVLMLVLITPLMAKEVVSDHLQNTPSRDAPAITLENVLEPLNSDNNDYTEANIEKRSVYRSMCNGPVKCSSHGFCVGFERGKIYCYGSGSGCHWQKGDCTVDADCARMFTVRSPKYTDGHYLKCDPKPDGWWGEACACQPGADSGMCYGPTKCGSHGFCVGFEGRKVYCYGSKSGCNWNTGDCNTDADCTRKFTRRSPKYTDGFAVNCKKNPLGWHADACKCQAGSEITKPGADPGMCYGPTKCGIHGFCVGFEGQKVYCYGSNPGCNWNMGDCNTDADCTRKFTRSSPKYTDGLAVNCKNNPLGWSADACKCQAGSELTEPDVVGDTIENNVEDDIEYNMENDIEDPYVETNKEGYDEIEVLLE